MGPEHIQAAQGGQSEILSLEEIARRWVVGAAGREDVHDITVDDLWQLRQQIISVEDYETYGTRSKDGKVELDPIDKEELDALLGSLAILGRTSPEQLMQLPSENRRRVRGFAMTVLKEAFAADKRHVRMYKDSLTGAHNADGRDRVLGSWRKSVYNSERRRIIDASTAPQQILPEVKTALVAIDITKFSEINNTFGHHIGDAALQELYHMIDDIVRREDKPILVRPGGDEFEVLFGNISEDDFSGFMSRLHASEAAKVGRGKYRKLWERLYSYADAHSQDSFTVLHEDKGDDIDVAYLGVRTAKGTEKIAPLRDIIVMSAGGVYQNILVPEGFEQAKRSADAKAYEHKGYLHSRMQGSHR